ncbi:hypothetical protein [Amnibacterium endophyticum]|uniref:DUF559 domain-containing protein n=1 Tax=Amnibacterium endophyticum TaxID=2109337 RepID=A0ABW4LDL7_9MICO
MGTFSFFTTAELRALGETKQSIRASIECGERFRVIDGWYGTSSTPQEAVLAMRMGGRVGCVSALRLHGAWCPPDSGLHVFFPPSASGRRSAGRDQGVGVVRHWHGRQMAGGSAFAVPPIDLALRDALECQPPHMLVAVLDSLLRRRLMSRNRLEALVRRGPERNHHLLTHLDARSESGTESILRYRLAVSGISTSIQVVLRSRDRLDLEIDGWLAIEADGREHHAQQEAFTRDRARVVRVMREGRIVLQFSYAAIVYRWREVFDAIVAVMAQHAPVAP